MWLVEVTNMEGRAVEGRAVRAHVLSTGHCLYFLGQQTHLSSLAPLVYMSLSRAVFFLIRPVSLAIMIIPGVNTRYKLVQSHYLILPTLS